jgi:hypothetical protein
MPKRLVPAKGLSSWMRPSSSLHRRLRHCPWSWLACAGSSIIHAPAMHSTKIGKTYPSAPLSSVLKRTLYLHAQRSANEAIPQSLDWYLVLVRHHVLPYLVTQGRSGLTWPQRYEGDRAKPGRLLCSVGILEAASCVLKQPRAVSCIFS